ncbi:MAG: DUF4440 domain-containing protein [Verrucomicrobia bacterium]|nr:DUF4440 domain-containing protein [Verrucomicrobiota bacterium]
MIIPRVIISAVLMPAALLAQATAPTAQSDTELEKELTRIARERILLFDKGDPTLWSPYVHPRYFIATPSAALQSKEQVMHGFRPPLAGYSDDFHFEDVRIARDGDTAVMTYRIIETEDWDGQKVTTQPLRKTDTYILRDGRWLILASHETFYPTKPSRASVGGERLSDYAGVYRLMGSLAYRVAVSDDKLGLQEIGQPDRIDLLPESDTTFFTPDDTARYIFVRGSSGRVEQMLIRNNGYDLKAAKVE